MSCFGGRNGQITGTVSGGTAPYTLSWSPRGDAAATQTGLVAGTYTLTVIDRWGCVAAQSFNISQPGMWWGGGDGGEVVELGRWGWVVLVGGRGGCGWVRTGWWGREIEIGSPNHRGQSSLGNSPCLSSNKYLIWP